jgi:biopolymer transport protein ExbD
MKGNILIGMFMTLVILVVFAALIPLINSAITTALPSVDATTAILISLVPLAIAIVILGKILTNGMDAGIY